VGAAQEAEGGFVADVPPASTPTLTSMALLDGKVALVSGAGPGLGRDIALACGRQGATVAVAARTEARVEAIAAELEGLGAKALALRLDVCDPDSCRDAQRELRKPLRSCGRSRLSARRCFWSRSARGVTPLLSGSFRSLIHSFHPLVGAPDPRRNQHGRDEEGDKTEQCDELGDTGRIHGGAPLLPWRSATNGFMPLSI